MLCAAVYKRARLGMHMPIQTRQAALLDTWGVSVDEFMDELEVEEGRSGEEVLTWENFLGAIRQLPMAIGCVRV